MSINEFQGNVRLRSQERGTYKTGSALNEALMAIAGLGLLADYAVKNRQHEMRPVIGGIMESLVNVAHMEGVQIGEVDRYRAAKRTTAAQGVAFISIMLAELPVSTQPGAPRHPMPVLRDSVTSLAALATMVGSTLEECCAIAWTKS
tara:strand:+ start:22491 stop:22931 length:441 start_codon:yes stop_codon:yes gene_type:complete